MKFAVGLLLLGIGAALMFVASRGVETASGRGIYQSLMDGLKGESRTESGPAEQAEPERPNTGEDGMDGLVGIER